MAACMQNKQEESEVSRNPLEKDEQEVERLFKTKARLHSVQEFNLRNSDTNDSVVFVKVMYEDGAPQAKKVEDDEKRKESAMPLVKVVAYEDGSKMCYLVPDKLGFREGLGRRHEIFPDPIVKDGHLEVVLKFKDLRNPKADPVPVPIEQVNLTQE